MVGWPGSGWSGGVSCQSSVWCGQQTFWTGVSLDLECLDRIYLNGYVPNLQVGGQIVQFSRAARFPIPSPVVVGRIGDQFRRSVRRSPTPTRSR